MTSYSPRNMKLTAGFLALAFSVVCARSVAAQAPPDASRTFEVASVHVDGADPGMANFPEFPSAQFTAEHLPMTILIAMAYGVSDNQITGKPDWMDSTLYSVHAKPEGDAALTDKQYQPLLQQFLKDRFKLAAHRETRDVSGYVLVVAKGGPKLTSAPEADAMAYILPNGLRCASLKVKTLASLLSRPLGHPVVDKTGIAGSYKLDFSFAPAESTDSTLPSIFTAIQEQLGLKLEAQKVPEEFLVIDHVDKIPSEN